MIQERLSGRVSLTETVRLRLWDVRSKSLRIGAALSRKMPSGTWMSWIGKY
jgi:hypothetical protein